MKIKNLSFKFNNQSADFFKNLSVEFQNNQINFIQGKNGVGKSTLFNILLGTHESHTVLHGTLELNGQHYEIKNNLIDPKLSAQIKLVQQQFDRMLANNFSYTQNLQLANLPTHPGLNSLPKAQNLPATIKNLNIPLETPVKLLSGGQRQILAILMALQKPTHILLLDEPTAALDEKNARMVMEFLADLAENANLTILIISHDRDLVLKYGKHGYYQMHEQEDGTRTIEKNIKQ